MNILLTGATGFIGSHLRARLSEDGHAVRLAGRRPPSALHPGERWVALDLSRPEDAPSWAAALDGVDVLVNAVGILRERGGQTFARLHTEGPRSLFAAACQAGVPRVLQISALGADEAAQSPYHLSKKAADDFLLTLPTAAVIVQPSLVYGPGGASARLFTMLAALPLLPLPASGHQRIQPIHIDDLVEGLIALLTDPAAVGRRIALVGPEPLTLREYLQTLRRAMGMGRALTVSVPAGLVSATAGWMGRVPGSALDADTWQMLQRGNEASAGDTERLLGHPPRAAAAFVPAPFAREIRRSAVLDALLPVLRLSIALVWIVTGIVSLGVYPVEESYALLARAGVEGALAPWALYGAALLDLALGIATLAPSRRRWLWLAQMALILGYTAIISVRLPDYWLHPYGPVLKNLPMLAALWLLYLVDRREEPAT